MGYQGTVQSVSPFKFNIVSSLLSYKFNIVSFPLQTQLSEQAPHHQIEVFCRRLSFEKKPQSTKTTWASGLDFTVPTYYMASSISILSYDFMEKYV